MAQRVSPGQCENVSQTYGKHLSGIVQGAGCLPCFHAKYRTTPELPLADETGFPVVDNRPSVQKTGWMRICGANPCCDASPKSGWIRHEGGKRDTGIVCRVPEKQAGIQGKPAVAIVERNVRQETLSTGEMIRMPGRTKPRGKKNGISASWHSGFARVGSGSQSAVDKQRDVRQRPPVISQDFDLIGCIGRANESSAATKSWWSRNCGSTT